MTIVENRERLGKLAKTIREIADKAQGAEFKPEDRANWEKVNADYDALKTQIDLAERADAVDKYINAAAAPIPAGRAAADRSDATDEAEGIAAWMLRQSGRGDQIEERQIDAAKRAGINLASPELVLPFGKRLARNRETRAIGDNAMTVTTTGGGYMIPQGFSYQLEQALLAFNPIDQIATQLVTPTGNDYLWPTNNDTSAAGEMTAINTIVTEGTITVGLVTLNAYKGSSKIVIVPMELMQDSAFSMTSFLAERLGERLGRLRAAQTTTGTGSSAPNGCVTASTAGKTAAATTSFTADELLDLQHSVDPAYRSAAMNCGYMCHDNVLLATRKLKDGNGQYIWQPSVVEGKPDRILGWPVFTNQAMASSVAASAKTWLFGAFSKFIVRTVGEISIRRLVERYAEYGQEGWVAFTRFDSDLLDAGTHPLKHLVQAAS
jgi:HK97 family phage major capsid protein